MIRSASPELVTHLGPHVVTLAASPDGARVGGAGLSKRGEREVVEVLVATLAPPRTSSVLTRRAVDLLRTCGR